MSEELQKVNITFESGFTRTVECDYLALLKFSNTPGSDGIYQETSLVLDLKAVVMIELL